MTALALAKAECANFKPAGCLGMEIKPDGSQAKGIFGGKLCLLTTGNPCSYFETAVAPMAEYVREPRRAASYKEAVAQYRKAHGQVDTATVRKCRCGFPLGARERYCPTCRKGTRKESNRKAQQWRRLSAVKPENTSDSLAKSHGCSVVLRNQHQGSTPTSKAPLTADRDHPERKAVVCP